MNEAHGAMVAPQEPPPIQPTAGSTPSPAEPTPTATTQIYMMIEKVVQIHLNQNY